MHKRCYDPNFPSKRIFYDDFKYFEKLLRIKMLRMKEYIDFVSINNFIQFKNENRIAVIILQ